MKSSYRARRPFWWWRARRARNPLLRRPAAAQRLAVAAVLFVVLGTAVGGLLAVIGIHTVTVTDARRQAAGTHRISATVLGTDDATASTFGVDNSQTSYTARLSWMWHGHRHTGDQLTMSAPVYGSSTTTWVDDNGALIPRPLTDTDVTVIVVGVTLGATLLVAIVAVAVARLCYAWNLRRRAESWSTEWAAVAPLWTRHHGLR